MINNKIFFNESTTCQISETTESYSPITFQYYFVKVLSKVHIKKRNTRSDLINLS